MFNMTMREAQQRASQHGGYIKRTSAGDFRVGKHEWTRKEREAREYFTDDLEDAALTVGRL